MFLGIKTIVIFKREQRIDFVRTIKDLITLSQSIGVDFLE